MTPELPPEFVNEIRRACADAKEAAHGAGAALARARRLIGWQGWEEWLERTCGLSTSDARLLIESADEPDADEATPDAIRPFLREQATVVCGWCEHDRAAQGLPPRYVSGPEQSPRVVHGVCPDCERAFEERLARYREPPPPDQDLPPIDEEDERPDPRRPFAFVSHAEDLEKARGALQRAFFHVDQADDAVRALVGLRSLALKAGVQESAAELADVLDRLTRLAAELVLVSRGEDNWDTEPFEPGPRP